MGISVDEHEESTIERNDAGRLGLLDVASLRTQSRGAQLGPRADVQILFWAIHKSRKFGKNIFFLIIGFFKQKQFFFSRHYSSTPTWNVPTWTSRELLLAVLKLVKIFCSTFRIAKHHSWLISAPTLKMPVLNITGSLSPHIDDTVTFNGRLEPTKTNWMKVCKILTQTLLLGFNFSNNFRLAIAV